MREHGGVKHAVGELLTCPFCLAQWVGTGFVFGYVTAPKATRLAALTMTMVAGSDVLQFVYDAIQNGGLAPAEDSTGPLRSRPRRGAAGRGPPSGGLGASARPAAGTRARPIL